VARDALSGPPREPLLRFENVDAGPPGASRPLLRGLDFALEAGQVGVLLGENGAGKSTLLRTASGLWPPLGGRVRVGGETGFNIGRVGLVLEDPSVQFVTGTVASEVAFPLENLGWTTPRIRDRIAVALSVFRLESLASRDPRTLSGGEQHRLLIASAWAPGPDLLVLDDPFESLGSEGYVLWDEIAGRVRRGDLGGALLATHDADLGVNADRVGVLVGGKLVAWGDPAAVLRGSLPPGLAPPAAVWLERDLGLAGWTLPEGALDPEAAAERASGATR
jgi:energy-coupling factor transporter ATP-binding protein EcfA2